MSEPPIPPESQPGEAVPEWLTSFLDGEARDEEKARAREAITQSSAWKKEAESLQQAWDLLDYLPKTEVGEEQTRATMEVILHQAGEENPEAPATVPSTQGLDQRIECPVVPSGAQKSGVAARWKKARNLGVWAGWVLAGAVIGGGVFWGIQNMESQRMQRIQKIQGVVENLTLLREAGNLEFLRALDQSGLFDSTSSGEGP